MLTWCEAPRVCRISIFVSLENALTVFSGYTLWSDNGTTFKKLVEYQKMRLWLPKHKSGDHLFMPTSPPKLRNRHLFHAIIYFEWVLSQICALLPCISHYEPKNEMAQFSLCSSFLKLSHHHDTIPCKKTAHAHSYLTKRHTLALVSVAKSISLLILPSASQLVLWVVWTSLLWSSQVKWRCTQFPTYRVTHSCGCGGNFREPWAGGDKWVLPWVGVSWALAWWVCRRSPRPH